MDYLKVQSSGKRNMFGYDRLIQKGDNYEKAYKHFVENKKEIDLVVEEEPNDLDYCKKCNAVMRFNKCSNGCDD